MRISGDGGRIPRWRVFLSLFFGGFLLGIIFGCISGEQYLDYAGILSEYYLNRYKHMELMKGQLFLYLLQERLQPFLLLLLFSFTSLKWLILGVSLIWIGFSFGTVWTISVILFGGKGLFLCVFSVIPQWLFYAAAILLLAESIQRNYWLKRRAVGEVMRYCSIIVLLVAGILLESWINPELVQIFLKFL